jgi:hypothetical protein
MKISRKPAQKDKIGYKPEGKSRSRASQCPEIEVYGVSTRYIPNTNTVAAKGIAIPLPKQGMPDHPFHPSGGSCPHGLGAVASDASRGGGNHFPGTSSMAAMYGMWDGANMVSASGMSPLSSSSIMPW